MKDILRENCSAQYAGYVARDMGPNGTDYKVFHVVECLLHQFPEFRKSEMAASAVILGLLPTTLQSLGSTSAETSLLGLRRPVLALLVSRPVPPPLSPMPPFRVPHFFPSRFARVAKQNPSRVVANKSAP